MSFDPQAYAPGDVVKITRTVKVTNVFANEFWAKDVQDRPHRIGFRNTGTAKVEMVKKAARPKPKTGETLTGKEVGKVQWKRGSVIRCTLAPRLPALVLFADGKWHDIEGVSAFEFDDLSPEAPFEVLLVA